MTSLFSVKDKTVVITGGSGYLGKEWVACFGNEGALVFNWDILESNDVLDYEKMRGHTEAIIDRYKKIDVLICGAALNAPFNHPYERHPSPSFIQELHVNLVETQNTIKLVATRMMQQHNAGSIILVSSELGLIGPNNSLYPPDEPKDIGYITSKTGILGLMRAWASYLAPYGIRVNALCPGGVKKDQSEEFEEKYGGLNMLGRMAQRHEMNGPLFFLASDASSFMTGATLVVDGGRTAW